MEDGGVAVGGLKGADVEEHHEGLEGAEAEGHAEETGEEDEGVFLEEFGAEADGGEPEESARPADPVGTDKEGEAHGQESKDGPEGAAGHFFFAGAEDDEATGDGAADVSGGGDKEDVSAGDRGFSAAVEVDGDVLDLSASGKSGEGVSEFVDVGVEEGEGEDEDLEKGDEPDAGREDCGGQEELLVLAHGHRLVYVTSGEGSGMLSLWVDL